MKEKSFFVSYFICILYCFFCIFFFCILTLGLFGVLMAPLNDLAKQDIFKLVFFIIGLILLPTVFLVRLLLRFRTYFVRTHISEEGLTCTVFGKEFKRIKWSRVEHNIALELKYPSFRKAFIVYSVRPVEEKDMKGFYLLNGKKNDYFFLPYNRRVMEVLPKEYKPDRVYHVHEELPPPYMRPPFPAPKEKADDAPLS